MHGGGGADREAGGHGKIHAKVIREPPFNTGVEVIFFRGGEAFSDTARVGAEHFSTFLYYPKYRIFYMSCSICINCFCICAGRGANGGWV